MVKRVISLLLIFALALSLTSCSFLSELIDRRREYRRYTTEYPKQKENVDIVWIGEGLYCAEYNGKRYNLDNYNLFESMLKTSTSSSFEDYAADGDMLISWEWELLGMGFLHLYYSNTSDNPMFIYEIQTDYIELYIREDYNYETDTFVVEGTDQSFVFSDMLTLVDDSKSEHLRPYMISSDSIAVTLYSECCPRLRIALELVYVDNEWFAHVNRNPIYWFAVSDELLQMLNIDTAAPNS